MQRLRTTIYTTFILLLIITVTTASASNRSMRPAATPKATDKYIVCLDAGHGGKDAGAVGSTSANREKDINLAIVKEIARLLRNNCPDVKVVCTRETDVFVELGRRAEIANKAKADLFVSVHTNAIPRNAARRPMGVQSYTLTLRTAGTNLEVEKRENSVISYEADGKYNYNVYNPNSSESDIMLELMQQRDMEESVNFAKLAQKEMVQTAGRADMGVLQANLAVLRLTYMPSVLLEVGYISTPAEENFLMSNNGRITMARSIYNAIVQYKAKVTGRQSTLVSVDKEDNSDYDDQPAPSTPTQQTTSGTKGKETSQKSQPQPTLSADLPVFKIQILAGTYDLKPNDRQFKGLKTEKVKDGSRYKYFYYASNDYNEVLKKKNEIKDQFPGCYIVAFKNGKLVDVNAAISEWKKKR